MKRTVFGSSEEVAVLEPRQKTMRAAAIDRFGGVELVSLHTLPVPKVGSHEVLIRAACAGVAEVGANEGHKPAWISASMYVCSHPGIDLAGWPVVG